MISHSSYVAGHGCPRAIWLGRNARNRARRGHVERHQLSGIVAHRALELAVGSGWPSGVWADSYDASWEAAASESGVDDWRRLPGAPLAYVKLRRWLLDEEADTVAAEAEVYLSTPDEVVQGRADLVVDHSSRGLGILDLKTGRAADSPLGGGVLRQLELYAAVLEEAGRTVEWLGLLSSTGKHKTVPHDRASSTTVIREVRAAGLAADVPDVPPGQPDPVACFSCGWLPGCDEGSDALDGSTRHVVLKRLDQSAEGPSAIVEDVTSGEVERIDLVERPTEDHERPVRLVECEGQHRIVDGG